MANTLTLDAAEFSEMVSQWENGGKYYVTLEITQDSNDGTTFTATVDEVTDYGDSEMETEPTPPPKSMKGAAKPPMPPMPNAKTPPSTAY